MEIFAALNGKNLAIAMEQPKTEIKNLERGPRSREILSQWKIYDNDSGLVSSRCFLCAANSNETWHLNGTVDKTKICLKLKKDIETLRS